MVAFSVLRAPAGTCAHNDEVVVLGPGAHYSRHRASGASLSPGERGKSVAAGGQLRAVSPGAGDPGGVTAGHSNGQEVTGHY